MQVANPVQTFDPLRASMPSVLMTQARMRIPICGKIRPGIKVLTTAACSNPDAAGIYEAGLRSGKSFDDIEALIKKAVPSLSATKFLIPYNVPYFSIFPGDFHNPKVARQILDKYGEDRGDGVKRLYAFDVVFPADTWDLILPHSLRCYGFNELKYWSEFEPDGRTMRCMTRAPVAKDTTGARFVRTFGGRKSIPRPDTNGKCDPETCPQFQDESCTVSGEFVFYIPGIVGLEAFSVPTSSIYSLQNAMKKFQMIISGGGRVAGSFGDGVTFRLSKQLKEVSRIDRKDGKAKRVLQELIVLDANVNMVGMLAGPTTDNLLRRGGENVVILEGHKSPGNNVEVDNGSIGSAARSTQGPVTIDQATTETPAGTASAESAAVSALKQQRSLVQTIIEHMGIKAEDFAAYAIGRWGEKWSRTPAVLASVIRELQNAAAPDVDAYKLHIQIHAQLAKMGIADPLFGEYAIQKWGAGWATDPSNLGSALAEIRAHASEPEAYGSALQGEVSQA